MNKQKFVEFIRKPKTLTETDIEELEGVVAEFPYFQNARFILAKGKKLNSHPDADKRVASAAIYAADRAFLKKYLTDEIIFLRPLRVTESVGEPGEPVAKGIPKPVFDSPKIEKEAPTPKVKKTEPVTEKPVPLVQKPDEQKAEPAAPKTEPVTAPKPEQKAPPKQEESKKQDVESKPVTIKPVQESRPAFTEEDAKRVKEELSKPTDLDDLIEELQHDMEELRRSRARLNEIEKKLEEDDAVEKAVEKATTKASKKKAVEKPASQPEKTPTAKEPKKKKETEPDPSVDHKKIKKEQSSIIDNFLSKNPSMPPNANKAEKSVQDLSVDSGKFNPEVASEYLAEIFIQQGHKDKAIEIYKTLIVKFPDKSVYFADLIKKLES